MAELKVAAWYIMDSREEAHWMFPPSFSTVSSISSEVRDPVDLKARRSMMWLAPRSDSFS
jgi:hypothetical protein